MLLRHKVLFFALILLLVLLTVWLARIEPEGVFKEFVLRYGYAGLFVAAFVGGFNVLVPISHLVFVIPLLNIGLNPWVLIIIGALGTALADSVGYVLGRGGETAFPNTFQRFKTWGQILMTKRPRLAPMVLFAWASFVPLPNELLVIPAGVLRYGFLRTMLITLAGNFVFNILAVKFGGLFTIG